MPDNNKCNVDALFMDPTTVFGKFGQRLTECAAMYKNKTIVRGSEAYTSKQCGRCGTLNDNLGSSSTFTCGSCTLVSDRDIHAARNILLRFIE